MEARVGAFSSDDACSFADATVKYWDIRQRQCVDTLRGHKSTVFGVAAACKGDGVPCMYFTGSRDHTIKASGFEGLTRLPLFAPRQ